jgi:hypothetical protein
MVGPKTETPESTCTTFQAKGFISEQGTICWRYDESDCPIARSNQLLVRITVAKVEDKPLLVNILRGIPIRQGDEGWKCIGWVQEALNAILKDGKAVGTSVLDWGRVRDGAMDYCRDKVNGHRFDVYGGFDMSVVPTYDLMQGKEITI